MPVVKKIRPVCCHFIYVKRICTVWEQSFVHFFEVFRLVPVDGVGEAPIEMHLDEVVVISGIRYKFQK